MNKKVRREFLFTGLLAPRHDIASGKWTISSEFGQRVLDGVKQQHKGVDIATFVQTALYSPVDGVVEIANRNAKSSAGVYVAIRCANGDLLRFLHLHSLEVCVVQGLIVRKGMRLGRTGNTGNSTGAHLHIDVQVDGVYIEPIKYLGYV